MQHDDALFISFDDAWTSFQSRDALRVTGGTPAFARGRAQLLVFLVRIEGSAARAYIARVLDRIVRIDGVVPLPDTHWHITIKLAGFQVIKRTHQDDVLRQDVPRLGNEARASLTAARACDVQLGPANAFPDAAVVEVHDGGALRALHDRLGAVVGVAHYPFDGESYLPHVSVARFSSNAGIEELRAALAELREAGPGPGMAVRRVELVRAWLTEEPGQDVLATYALAGGGGP